MEVDQSAAQQVNPFVYIQYPSTPSSSTTHLPSSSRQTSVPQTDTHQNHSLQQETPLRRKRQQNGPACDKCRERRVGCDRGKPTCGPCDGKYNCVYSNHALRLDNVSMRQRMDTMQSTISRMYDVLMRLEYDYRDTVPRIIDQQQQRQHQHQQSQYLDLPSSPPPIDNNNNGDLLKDPSQVAPYGQKQDSLTIVDWASKTGWLVSANYDGSTTIQTDITSYEHLGDAVRRALQMSHRFQTPSPLHSSPTFPQSPISADDLPSFSAFEKLGRIPSRLALNPSPSHTSSPFSSASSSTSSSSSFSASSSSSASSSKSAAKHPDKLLETDVMTRLIKQHHQCGFPILVSPSRFERHYQQGALQSVVLSSIFCHIAPHACIYHPELVHLQDFRTLGERFYDHSRTELGLDDHAPTLSNIHQRTLLITYDLDLGRVRRAFLHLGVAIRMCFALDLNRPEGYQHFTNAFDREQAKRVFWTVWFYDSMVPHFFAQSSTIRNDDIKVQVPCVLPDFDPIETDQTRFAISVIHIRRIHSQKSLRAFYRSLPETGRCHRMRSMVSATSIWTRRTYFCVLLDYCLRWITLYRTKLPHKLAIRRTSQAAFAMLHLFGCWFGIGKHFDCFFRPYLFHYMSIIQVFKNNITQQDGGERSPLLVAQSQAALVKLFHMYRLTPTHRSFAESQLEKSLAVFIQHNGILSLSQLYYGAHQEPDPGCIEELMDDPEDSAYFGWGIFSVRKEGSVSGSDSISSSTSSASSLDSAFRNAMYHYPRS